MVKAISLFAGAGGCSLGLKQAGIDVSLAVDLDKDACASYAANIAPQGIVQADLSSVTPWTLLERVGLRRGDVDLVVGGPPCQGFSSAGARDWNDPRNTLVRKFVEFVLLVRPTWFVMENVEGLLTAAQGSYFVEAISRLLEGGYWLCAKKVYMERYGLPQKRKRVVVVGNLEQREFVFPEPTHESAKQPSLFPHSTHLNLADAISDLPTPKPGGLVSYADAAKNDYQQRIRRVDGRHISHHEFKQLNEANRQRVLLMNPGHTMRDLPSELQHPSFARRAFRRVMDGTPTEKRGGAPAGLKRLRLDTPCLTITSASPSEFVHPVENRLLTLRECARIQSFPDWFTFSGTWSSVATQIGNAIPPLFMEVLIKQIKGSASWVPSPESRGRWLGIDATKATAMSPVLANMLRELEERTYVFAR